jgi:hypothetical protein
MNEWYKEGKTVYYVWNKTAVVVKLGFESRQGLGIFLFTTASRQALGPIQPPIRWVPGALSLGLKRLGREGDHSLLSSAVANNAWSYTSSPSARLHDMVLS